MTRLEREVVDAAIAWAEADCTDHAEEAEDALAGAVDRLRRERTRPRLALVKPETCLAPECMHAADGGSGYCLTHALLLSLEEQQQGRSRHG